LSFTLSIQIDPHTVLGVAPGASMHEIREAYRRKAKQHHPDVGGEDWAFRILLQSYEVLSTARVVQATQAEYRARSARPEPSADGAAAAAGPGASTRGQARGEPWGAGASANSATSAQTETIRPGVRDTSDDPTKVVDVEKLWVRFEVDHLWLLQDGSREDRSLSCCLNISWPEPELASHAEDIPDGPETLRKLNEAFEQVHLGTPASNSRCKVEDHRFQGWLSYPTTQLAWSAFNKLHEELNARGLRVKQWTRDLIIPRDWR
jgi:curved DNA-binding protein CbpA